MGKHSLVCKIVFSLLLIGGLNWGLVGLGTLIAKLKDKGHEFDPGLANQIHLINQIRIHCVHKKTSILNPSKNQTKAIILYTVDVLNKFFTTKSE